MSDVVQFLFRFSLFALLHSVLALPALKKLCTGRSRHLHRFYRMYYNFVSLLLFGWVMAAYHNSAVLYVVPGVWSLVLYLMQLVFFIILFTCVRQTGMAEFLGVSRNASDDSITPKLVTNGWYRVVRHPMYLFTILFLLSNPVISTRWILLTLMSTVYFLIGACLEENRLLQEFGIEYLEYKRAVPFILPRILPSQRRI